MPVSGRVTSRDVAKAAGVSQTTVSFVLNDNPRQKIASETRQRVLDAAQELGYVPSQAARSLRRGRSDTVLVALPATPLGTAATILINHLTDVLEAHGLYVMTRRPHPNQPLSAMWNGLDPAAVVGLEPLDAADQQVLRAAGITSVFPGVSDTSSAGFSNAAYELVGALQVQHLASQGHYHIGYAVPGDHRLSLYGNRRLEGVRRACLDLGLQEPVTVELELDPASATVAVRQWHERQPQVTAVCAYNDDYAFAVLAGMRALGLTAPDDLAVIGCDNVPLAPLAQPPLTTIDIHPELVADHIARFITDTLAGKQPPPAPRSDALEILVRQSA